MSVGLHTGGVATLQVAAAAELIQPQVPGEWKGLTAFAAGKDGMQE